MATQVTFPCHALDKGLNAAILHIAAKLFPTGYDVAPDAPDTLKKLNARLDAGERMVVYDGFSDKTIYGDREVNYAFRAWHDWCHWRGCFDFSIAGEMAAFEMQRDHIIALYGYNCATQWWLAILAAEVYGQALYYARHKRFISDQRGFVEAYLVDPEKALDRADW